MRVTIADLPAISLGAAVLGTGGGGNPYTGRLALRRQMELTGHEPLLIDPALLADDATVLCIGMAGSPSVGMEKLLAESFAIVPVREMERMLGRKADALIPIEVGGVNSLMPLISACATGLPVVDADGMGRAFPTLDKTTFGIAGVSPFPVLLANEHGETVIVAHARPHRAERISRTAMVDLGGACIGALYTMTGREVKDVALHNTLTLAFGIGRAIEAARRAKDDPVAAILGHLAHAPRPTYGRVLFEGKVVDVTRAMVGGYNTGSGILESESGTATFAFQNEYLYLKEGERMQAIVPDLVIFLDSDTADPIMCESVRYGQRVRVIGISAPPQLKTPAGLRACGPAGFGLPYDFEPMTP